MQDVDRGRKSSRGGRRPAVALGTAVLLLAVSAAYLVTALRQNLLIAGPGFTNRVGNGIGTDFPAFYAAGAEARHGRAARVYDMDALRTAHGAVRGVDAPRYAWAYPPTFLLLMAPVTLLSLPAAMWTWLAVTTAGLLAAAMHIVPSPLTPLLVLLFPGMTMSVIAGPTGTLCAALVVAGLVALDRHPRLAGVCFGLLTVKPHIAALIPLCLLAAHRWTALASFGATAFALVGASLVAFGTAPWAEFVAALPRHMAIVVAGEARWQRMPTVFAAVHHATGATDLAWAMQAITTLVVAAVCAFVWFRGRDDVARALAITAGMPLMGPYAYDYDTGVLVAPILYVARSMSAGRAAARDVVLVAGLWLTPVVLWLGSTAIGQQIGPLLLGAALAEAVRRATAQLPDDTAASSSGSPGRSS